MTSPWVVKAGGELLAEHAARKKILADVKSLRGQRPIVFVHGGGPQIEQELAKSGIAHAFSGGRRITSPEAMIVVERVLSGQINKGLAAELNSLGVPAVGLSGRDAKTAVGEPLEGLGRAAKPVKINAALLVILLKSGFTPVVSSVASDMEGNAVNINADDFASALAVALKAENLVTLTNVAGVMDQNGKIMKGLKISKIDDLIENSVVHGGMIPKLQAARKAIQNGVRKMTILNGREGVKLHHGTAITK